MTEFINNRAPLVTQPLKTSPATGAVIASLGFSGSIPLLHGAQGCAAFSKIYLISHFREPIPIQNTAIDHISAVMGGDDNLTEALALLCDKHEPELISVMTTGLTEMQGTDLTRVIMDFKQSHPNYASVEIVGMNTPDFSGSMQTGFAHAVDRIVRQVVKAPTGLRREKKLVTVLCSVSMTSADIETLKRYLSAFDLESIFVPDISLSMDGHMENADYSPTSMGGTSMQEVEMISDSVATIVIGGSMLPTAKWLERRFSIPFISTSMGMGIDEADALIMALSELSSKTVPQWITRERQRLQDAMVDSHFFVSASSISMALEPDLTMGYSLLLNSMGANIDRVVTTIDNAAVRTINANKIIIGDLSHVADSGASVDLIIGNSHAAQIYEPQIPVVRAGYPCHDQFGNMDVRQFGYEGSRERLFAIANQLMHRVKEVEPHVSEYRVDAEQVVPNYEW
ncbi:nitrogenase iron-molybdenum cofactor biosynthesis protein NifN [Vibrio sp. 10N.286.49.B3]|uniref:nitrogenase iron-molybdenum cofactor biosynthesis protein NifN n=1 Tax=Vibrio sp. 10N.286.49.B3 TaxID=1880855 RepID=UPI000C85B708|nr:nitrogenase iron-molybdenum cofactor biosynthesis protein NifN [Vibrio sp. 10N.286.49.B3]PMH44852.1 nitrogenase iron-molybdenum cofactor biosynthesis protein NifN [Vibrio sp. 10N.286.49.B3]